MKRLRKRRGGRRAPPPPSEPPPPRPARSDGDDDDGVGSDASHHSSLSAASPPERSEMIELGLGALGKLRLLQARPPVDETGVAPVRLPAHLRYSSDEEGRPVPSADGRGLLPPDMPPTGADDDVIESSDEGDDADDSDDDALAFAGRRPVARLLTLPGMEEDDGADGVHAALHDAATGGPRRKLAPAVAGRRLLLPSRPGRLAQTLHMPPHLNAVQRAGAAPLDLRLLHLVERPGGMSDEEEEKEEELPPPPPPPQMVSVEVQVGGEGRTIETQTYEPAHRSIGCSPMEIEEEVDVVPAPVVMLQPPPTPPAALAEEHGAADRQPVRQPPAAVAVHTPPELYLGVRVDGTYSALGAMPEHTFLHVADLDAEAAAALTAVPLPLSAAPLPAEPPAGSAAAVGGRNAEQSLRRQAVFLGVTDVLTPPDASDAGDADGAPAEPERERPLTAAQLRRQRLAREAESMRRLVEQLDELAASADAMEEDLAVSRDLAERVEEAAAARRPSAIATSTLLARAAVAMRDGEDEPLHPLVERSLEAMGLHGPTKRIPAPGSPERTVAAAELADDDVRAAHALLDEIEAGLLGKEAPPLEPQPQQHTAARRAGSTPGGGRRRRHGDRPRRAVRRKRPRPRRARSAAEVAMLMTAA
eukprot:PLAT6819.11.p1 GENE.PLAT6819.11~~PLAT6819.11.p1  ORF type:complete len:689 (+),score=266.64 PLAT6819.11:131-2068(+)